MGKLINIIRDKYTTIPSEVFRDRRLGLKARGLLTTLISLPNGWNFSVRGLASLTDDDGVDAVNSVLQKLEQLGYLERIQVHSKQGTFGGYDYKINIPPLAAD